MNLPRGHVRPALEIVNAALRGGGGCLDSLQALRHALQAALSHTMRSSELLELSHQPAWVRLRGGLGLNVSAVAWRLGFEGECGCVAVGV